MKFGYDFHKHREVEWSGRYTPYSKLKKLIKTIRKSPLSDTPDSAADLVTRTLAEDQKQLLSLIDSTIKYLSQFYNQELANIECQEHVLRDACGKHYETDILTSTSTKQLEQIGGALLDLRRRYQKLYRFGAVNRDALLRISEKLDKNSKSDDRLPALDEAELLRLDFAEQTVCLKHIARINQSINAVSTALLSDATGPTMPKDAPWKSSTRFADSMRGITDTKGKLSSHDLGMLRSADRRGRLPIHYIAEYGLTDVCSMTIDHTQSRELTHRDREGRTAFELAVLSGNINIVNQLLKFTPSSSIGSSMLCAAIRLQNLELVKVLVGLSDVDSHDAEGETPLHIAAQLSWEPCVELLLAAGADVNATAIDSARTTLDYACIYGDKDVASSLIAAGASLDDRDAYGWTPMEHAAYRGHMSIVELLQASGAKHREMSQVKQAPSSRHIIDFVLEKDSVSAQRLFINLGSLNAPKDKLPALDVSGYRPELFYEPSLDSSLCLEVSISGTSQPAKLVRLPLLHDTVNEPIDFTVKDTSKTILTFRLLCIATSRSQARVVGAGIALLGDIFRSDTGLESLHRDFTIPILAASTTTPLGTLTFSLLLVKPISASYNPVKPPSWDFGNRLGGHRGLGQNKTAWTHLQIGENTVESFLTGIRLGASFVELDVQITKDHVPVIYHDFLVSETGLDAPMHTLNLDQFLYLSEVQQWCRPAQRHRSRSLGKDTDPRMPEFQNRMTKTLEWHLNGYKPNERRRFVHQPFITLQRLLTELPEHVPLNMEIKYPMLFETDDWQMDPHFPEVNDFVDTIFDIIFRFAGHRPIMFSSFSAEICIVASLKQRTYPIFYLNDGRFPVGDRRASCLQQAIHFAKRWKLAGIVMESKPYVECPRLVAYARSFGLASATYGPLNNEPDCTKIQFDAGMDAVIVDFVHLIAKKGGAGEAGAKS